MSPSFGTLVRHRVDRKFYDRETTLVARELLGTWLVHRDRDSFRAGRIVEVEAYLGPHDRAAHSARGRTPRTEVMFGPPGHAYVYLIYGVHCCMNVVTEPDGQAAAVLIRALEPLHGIEQRTQGPGLLCKAMGIDRRHSGHDLLGDTLFIASGLGEPVRSIVKRPRIGVEYAGAWAKRLLRFYERGNQYISRR